MVDLTKVKDVSFKLDEKGKLRAQIGLNIGMIPMLIAAFIATAILSKMQLWLKISAGIGIACMLIMQISGVVGAIGRYKAYVSAMAEYEKFNTTPTTTSAQPAYTG